MLGPLLFILYINDLPELVKTHCKLFADDANIDKEISSIKGFEDIQDDLYELCKYTAKWLLFFNLQKCKVVHLGINNPCWEYKMTDKCGKIVAIYEVQREKDLGIIFQKTLSLLNILIRLQIKPTKELVLLRGPFPSWINLHS